MRFYTAYMLYLGSAQNGLQHANTQERPSGRVGRVREHCWGVIEVGGSERESGTCWKRVTRLWWRTQDGSRCPPVKGSPVRNRSESALLRPTRACASGKPCVWNSGFEVVGGTAHRRNGGWDLNSVCPIHTAIISEVARWARSCTHIDSMPWLEFVKVFKTEVVETTLLAIPHVRRYVT